ncbi:MAG: hypothetical protein QM752_07190 [Gammaproteobacteria bacterium]
MKNHPKFYFSGLGCIEAFKKTETDAYIKLKVLMGPSDDLVLGCLVESKRLIEAITQLSTGQKTIGQGILVKFKIEYKGFDYWYPGRFDGDPLNLLQFQGVLTHGKV